MVLHHFVGGLVGDADS